MSEKNKAASRTRKPATGGADSTVAKGVTQPAEKAKPPQEVMTSEGLTAQQKASIEKIVLDDAAVPVTGKAELPDGVLGCFDVTAKSEQGFWRCGVKFERLVVTRVYVAELVDGNRFERDGNDVFMRPDDARRVHAEPNLTVTDVETAE